MHITPSFCVITSYLYINYKMGQAFGILHMQSIHLYTELVKVLYLLRAINALIIAKKRPTKVVVVG